VRTNVRSLNETCILIGSALLVLVAMVISHILSFLLIGSGTLKWPAISIEKVVG